MMHAGKSRERIIFCSNILISRISVSAFTDSVMVDSTLCKTSPGHAGVEVPHAESTGAGAYR